MSKNKKKFIIGEIGSGILFFLGVIFLIIPIYYGLDNLDNIKSTNLFISFLIIFSILNVLFNYLIGTLPRGENIKNAIASITCGIIIIILEYYFNESFALSVGLVLFTIIITIIKLFTIDYYHDKKDAYFYIEGLSTGMFFIVGLILSLILFNEPLLQIIEVGFFTIILAIIESLRIACECLLKAPRFLKKIKF